MRIHCLFHCKSNIFGSDKTCNVKVFGFGKLWVAVLKKISFCHFILILNMWAMLSVSRMTNVWWEQEDTQIWRQGWIWLLKRACVWQSLWPMWHIINFIMGEASGVGVIVCVCVSFDLFSRCLWGRIKQKMWTALIWNRQNNQQPHSQGCCATAGPLDSTQNVDQTEPLLINRPFWLPKSKSIYLSK